MRLGLRFAVLGAALLASSIAVADEPVHREQPHISTPVQIASPTRLADSIRARLLRLAQNQCQPYGEGCGSCVADGVRGALWHNADCTTQCDKVCDNGPTQ